MYRIILTETAIAHYNAFVKSGNVKIINKIKLLLADIAQHPYTGIGKPEALKGNLSGFWSRRIDDANRLIYRINGEFIDILSCKGHYEDV